MPKMKTNKALSKRFKVSKKGKILRPHAGKSHLNSSKSPKRRRQLRRKGLVDSGITAKFLHAISPSL